jgi:16S rRNA (cytosine967-C5)-methyltransferase
MSARLKAVQILVQLLDQGKSLSQLREELLTVPVRDRGLVQELCYGVSRWYWRLDFIANQFLKKPLKAKDHDIHVLILLGLYQLLYLRIPAHAALSESVEVARKLKKEWATKLVNGVLRSFIKNESQALAKTLTDPEAHYAHPAWLIGKIKSAWPSWEAILQANNERPPFCIRVNARTTTREQYLTLLNDDGILAKIIPQTQYGVMLNSAIDTERLPGFLEGKVSVQDGGAQLASELLAPQAGERILDACAAPGGKTCHILELAPALKELVALDDDANRLQRLQENLQRLKLSATVVTHDVRDLAWWDGVPFDRILLDAPCSATGVINRHPDIKILRTEDDIQQLEKIQRAALEALWQTLKPHGYRLYVTCSILPEENERIVENFMQQRSDCTEVVIDSDWGVKVARGRQILPGMHLGMDGFYFCLLQKN